MHRLFLLFLGLLACAEPSEVSLDFQREPLVNADRESGWSGVGALTMEHPYMGYGGSFCTGTLIEPDWVLTAAHCIEGMRDEGLDPSPELIFFYEGPNANPVGFGERPRNGRFYPLSEIFVHPGYTHDAFMALNDVALLHLQQPSESSPYPIRREPLSEEVVGGELFAVGYGVSDGRNQSGGGIKRSASLALHSLNELFYVSDGGESGVCFGDSGGPGFMEIGGAWTVIGVNSTTASSGISDPCAGRSNQLRVDAYISWIDAQMGRSEGCAPLDCQCPEACTEVGYCDNQICHASFNCSEILSCLNSCAINDGCPVSCYFQGVEEARGLFDDVSSCLRSCENSNPTEYQSCIERRCAEEMMACQGQATQGTYSCEEVLHCHLGCETESCDDFCLERSREGAVPLFEALQSCTESSCGGGLRDSESRSCSQASCQSDWSNCRPPDNCRVQGGDCSEGACLPAPWGANYCYETEGLEEGSACNTLSPLLSCRDGLICLGTPSGSCQKMCQEDGDCAAELRCDLEQVKASPSVGACVEGCLDADQDGSCADQDCDDDDPQRAPNLSEICGDSLDNNCDEQVDEECQGAGDAGVDEPGDEDDSGFCAQGQPDAAFPLPLLLAAFLLLRRRDPSHP